MPRRNPLNPDPEALPPQQVRFLDLHVEPWPDGRRVRVHVSLTPFQQNPNLEAVILASDGHEVARASIIENADDRFVFTMHIRADPAAGIYSLAATIEYDDIGKVDERTVSFETSEAPSAGN